MLKDIVVLEINGKKESIGNIEIKTPNEFMFANRTEQIVNCHIFESFVDDMFLMTVEEIAYETDKKIKNVYITFIDDQDVLVCSIVLDRLRPKRGKCRVKIIDWQSTGFTFKYMIDNEDDVV